MTRSGNLSFPSNLSYRPDLVSAGGRAVQQTSGHLVLYGAHGRRILATDPDGNPLHECEWIAEPNGAVRLARARFRLDWGQWVGLKPRGLVNSTVLDLSRKPGWQRLRPDDLRHMAAQALRVPLDEIRFFYSDDDLTIDATGQATIRHKKDAFYILDDGTFDRARFMACMGAMHWSRIDFLPVVELFQSLLPGTGSAAFELIRGLYDDQNEGQPQPLPLRYRGIPTYPSDAAFRLFSAFFVPQASSGRKPFDVFMDSSQSHEVTWSPSPAPLRRYFDEPRRLCVTVKGETVQKVTLAEDPVGMSYINAQQSHGERRVGVSNEALILMDGTRHTEIPINPSWGPLRGNSVSPAVFPMSWRDLFVGAFPRVTPAEAFGAVLLYPDDATEIDEASVQPFVADYLQDLIEDSPQLGVLWAQARRILIDNVDGSLQSCVSLTADKEYRILYTRPALAQKQASLLWNAAVQAGRFDALAHVRLMPAEIHRKTVYRERFDWIYRWVPYSCFEQPHELADVASALRQTLSPGGLAFVVGPQSMGAMLRSHSLCMMQMDSVDTFPTFRMHQTILPEARLKPTLTLFHVMQPVS
ncbi:MAG TPA: hypothetical protein VJV04_01745 [Nitrospiraceae bacterium]|nr:hypothetical protein [Nitrospiraceae bacterium]